MASLATPDVGNSLIAAQMAQQNAKATALTGSSETSGSLVTDAEKTKMKNKSKEFESFFIYQTIEMMKPQTDTAFSGGTGEEMFRHNLNEQIAKNITESGGFGIAHTVYSELLKQQEQRASTLAAAAKTYATTPTQH